MGLYDAVNLAQWFRFGRPPGGFLFGLLDDFKIRWAEPRGLGPRVWIFFPLARESMVLLAGFGVCFPAG